MPGKLILMGEHAVVYGRPALVAAVSLRLSVALAPGDRPGLRLLLPQLGVRETVDREALVERARAVRERWRAFAADLGPGSFLRLRADDPAHVVKVALGEAIEWCGPGPADSPLSVEVRSEIPIGSGFGSSAATAVGVVAGYLAHAGRELDPETVDRLALEVERRQHGLPSGVDHATVLRGGLLWATRRADGGFDMEGVRAAGPVLSRIRVYDSGRAGESTGAVVAAVRERLSGSPERSERLLERMERATRAFRGVVQREAADPGAAVEPIRDYQRSLEQLGVVPEAVQAIVRRVEAEGGAAKISGAGALSGSGGGVLLVYHPRPGTVSRWDFLSDYRRHAVGFGAEGLRREAAA